MASSFLKSFVRSGHKLNDLDVDALVWPSEDAAQGRVLLLTAAQQSAIKRVNHSSMICQLERSLAASLIAREGQSPAHPSLCALEGEVFSLHQWDDIIFGGRRFETPIQRKSLNRFKIF